MSNKDISIKYANDVINNIIPSCVYMKQSCRRYLKDLGNPLYFYNDIEVDKVVLFINTLYLTEQKTPKHFLLENWQTWIICNLYGLCNKETGLRKYRYGYIELARKNGKSQILTSLAMYDLIFGTDSQVIISANSLRQATDVDARKCKMFADQLDRKQKHLVQYYNSIKFGKNELLITATSPDKLDGLSPSFVLIDEFHEAPDNKMYSVFKSAMGSRDEPLFLIITTSGFDTESFCYQLRNYFLEILNESKIDEEQFICIWTIDSGDDITSRDTQLKANPNLDVSLKSSFLNSEINKALNNEIERPGIMVKHFNVWLQANSLESWLQESVIEQSLQPIDINDERFQELECWCGVDLSSVSDITSVSYMFQLDENLYFFNDYYIPEDSVTSNINRELYKEAASLGYIKITQGNVVDYDLILEDILKRHIKNPITELNYDKWNSSQFVINATQQNLNMKPFSQTPGSLNKPLKEFETLIKSGRIIIQKNSITRWMFSNISLKINHMGNYSIDKSSRTKKIDGVASMINSLGGYLESPRYTFNVY